MFYYQFLLLFFSYNIICSEISSNDLKELYSYPLEISQEFPLSLNEYSDISTLFERSFEELTSEMPFCQLYEDDGCFIKSHTINNYLHNNLIKSGSIYLFPKTQKELITISDEKINYELFLFNLAPASNMDNTWDYHTAAFVMDTNKTIYIFDHTFDAQKPLTIDEWLQFMNISKRNLDNFTLRISPPNSFGMKREIIANDFDAIKNINYLALPTEKGCNFNYSIILKREICDPIISLQHSAEILPEFSSSEYEAWRIKEFLPAQQKLIPKAQMRAQSIFNRLAMYINLNESDRENSSDESDDALEQLHFPASS